jgi:hypothetical protein
MNLPTDCVHHTTWSYGRLVFPLPGARWLAFFKRYGFRVVVGSFHNCRATGVY